MYKKIKWTSAILVGLYASLCLSVFSLQKKLIYTPTPTHPRNKRVKKIYNDSGKLLALDFDRDDSEETLIIFHGRDRNAGFRNYFSRVFGKKSRLIVIEYPGFGENFKEPLNKKNILKHCHEAMLHILSTIQGPFTIVGESLGTGIASEMASFYKMDKLILITPYATLADLAKNKFWFLPTKTLLRENYDSLKNLENYQGVVLFIISELDQLIPAKFGKKLFNGFEGLKQEIFVLGADHYTWWEKMTDKQKQIFRNFYEHN